MNKNGHKIVWADDEIDLLKPHILFLESKGYEVIEFNNGLDAYEYTRDHNADIVFLDENMPGIGGIETLEKIKSIKPHLPIVMITKNEEEYVMEDAIGSKISDYLIKPINPNQILLSLKKILHNKSIVQEKTIVNYRQQFNEISNRLNEELSLSEWMDVYKELTRWSIEMDGVEDEGLKSILLNQWVEANQYFNRSIKNNYAKWMNDAKSPITFSHRVIENLLKPLCNQSKLAVFVLDNLRYDQWKILESLIQEVYVTQKESLYSSILPTTTSYARNALFSGDLPAELHKKYDQFYAKGEDGLNDFEEDFVRQLFSKLNISQKVFYTKITNLQKGKLYLDNLNNTIKQDGVHFIVYNFVDILSHVRSEMNVLKELAPDEAGYRTLTKSWFMHSPLFEMIKMLAFKKVPIVITTDHGSIPVTKALKVATEKTSTNNLRYKHGRSLGFENSNLIYEVKNPEQIGLPKLNLSESYVFAGEQAYLVYPTNFNEFANKYKGSFQHGGISLEEMLVPFVYLEPK